MKTTNDLLDELLENVSDERSLDEYLHRIDTIEEKTFPEYFEMILKKNKKEKSEVIKEAQIERSFGYKILSGSKRATRDNLISLCIAAGCTVEELEKCLVLTGNNSLYSKNKRDSIIIYAISRGHSVLETNNLLSYKGEAVLKEV